MREVGRPKERRERYWVSAEVRPPGESHWRPMGLFVAGLDAADARLHFREELALRTGWTTGRKCVRKILSVVSVRELLGRAG